MGGGRKGKRGQGGCDEFRVEVGRGKEGKGEAMNLGWRLEGERKVRGAKCKVEVWRGKGR